MNPFFKIDAVTTTAAGLKGRAKYTYNHAATAITEDSTPAMLHAFAALTDGAKAIALQSGKYSNLYIRGERKGMTAEEAAKELAERAAGCVTRKLRKIDIVCAVAFLAEYISRQRKVDETPETPSPEPNNAALAIMADYNNYEVRPVSFKTIYNRVFWRNGAWHLIVYAHDYTAA